jgi:hypothetical protein
MMGTRGNGAASIALDQSASTTQPLVVGRWLVLLAAVAFLVGAGVLTRSQTVRLAGSAAPLAAPFSGGEQLGSVPPGAMAAASSTLGHASPVFDAVATRGGFRLAGGGVGTRLTTAGAGFTASDGTLSLDILREGRPLALSADGNRVTYRYAGMRAWYAAGPFGIEQGFTILHRQGSSRTLAVKLRLGGGLRARPDGSGIRFVNGSGRTELTYGGISAVDARGRSLKASLALDHGTLLLRVSDADATFPVRIDPFVAGGTEPLNGGTGGQIGEAAFGSSVAVSADDNWFLIGAPQNDSGKGAVFVFRRSGSSWIYSETLYGDCFAKCSTTGTGESGDGQFGSSVAISSDGSTIVVGAAADGEPSGSINPAPGAAWVFTRSAGYGFVPQGAKLVGNCTGSACANQGSGEIGDGQFGSSVALSSDGNTAIVGAPGDHGNGAAWVFTRSGSSWTQQKELVGDCDVSGCQNEGHGEMTDGQFGWSVSLSNDGNTALVGAPQDVGSGDGAVWVFARASAAWTEQGQPLVGNCTSACANEGTGEAGPGEFGWSVSLSANGNTALIGAPFDGGATSAGRAWVFTRSQTAWTQQTTLVGDCTGTCTNEGKGEVGSGELGTSVSLSGPGSTALIGAPQDSAPDGGSAFAFVESAGKWTPDGARIITKYPCLEGYTGAGDAFGASVALSSDAEIGLIGEPQEGECGSTGDGQAEIFTQGTPTSSAEISVQPSLAFSSDTVGEDSSVKTVTILNTGTATLKFTTAATIGGADPTDFQVPNSTYDQCVGKSVTPNHSCEIGVRFTPTSGGARSAELVLGASDAFETGVTVNLTGTGVVVPRQLQLVFAGSGQGQVTVSGGSHCGGDCTLTVNGGEPYALTATATTGSTFAGWGGEGCSGTGTCKITLAADGAVTAVFDKKAAGKGKAAQLLGVRLKKAKHHGERLTFTVVAGSSRLKSVRVKLPNYLHFVTAKHGVTVIPGGDKLSLRRGVLTITWRRAQKQVSAVIASPAIKVVKVKHRKRNLVVTITDATGHATTIARRA